MRNFRSVMSLVVAVGVAGGVLSQLYTVLSQVLQEQGRRETFTVLGRQVHVGAAAVLAGVVLLGAVGIAYSRWNESKDERELRAAIERQRKRGA